MIKLYPFEELGRANHGWLDARHHFSFADYYNPHRMGFGVLRVVNDDIIQPGTGFPTHPHRDMEIITYVRRGAISHKDSQGNEGRTVAGDVQVMSAGTGVAHSEYNLEEVETNIFQIWIEPKEYGVQPRWDSYEFPKQSANSELSLLVSGADNAPLWINQDAAIYAGSLVEGTEILQPITQQAYVLVSEGQVELEGRLMKKGDGAEVTELDLIRLQAIVDSEVLVIEVPEHKKTA
ncbi:MAG: pirin family protein [Porticoccaceae bacterium]|jgi:quercetin 2,3-dioxygenase|nr:pirin family protein [Porticoccaceae bacterium]